MRKTWKIMLTQLKTWSIIIFLSGKSNYMLQSSLFGSITLSKWLYIFHLTTRIDHQRCNSKKTYIIQILIRIGMLNWVSFVLKIGQLIKVYMTYWWRYSIVWKNLRQYNQQTKKLNRCIVILMKSIERLSNTRYLRFRNRVRRVIVLKINFILKRTL